MGVPNKADLVKEICKTKSAQTLSKKEIDVLVANTNVISYKKGETIFKQGAKINQYVILVKGLCKVTVENPVDDNGTIVSIQKSISIIGLTSLHDECYQATATALDDCVVVFIAKEDFATLLKTNVDFTYAMFEYLCDFARKFCRQIVDFSQKTIMSRVASSILYIADMVGDDYIDLPLTRKDLAEYSGIATGSTIRLLSELEHAGVIELEKKTIRIKNKEKLVLISQQE